MTTTTKIDFLYLSEQDMIRAGVTDMLACVNTILDQLDIERGNKLRQKVT